MKNAMVQVRAQKKAGSKLLWNLDLEYTISYLC